MEPIVTYTKLMCNNNPFYTASELVAITTPQKLCITNIVAHNPDRSVYDSLK
jgi:hypothetical protein